MSTAIAFFDDPAYINTAPGSDASNLLAQLQSYGKYTISTFSGTTATALTAALTGAELLVIPALDEGDLAASLNSGTIGVIDTFVSAGGGLIITGDQANHAVTFLNDCFAYSTSSHSPNFPYPLVNNGSSTAFAGGPSSLAGNTNASGLLISGLPTGSQNIYEGSGTIGTTVALLPYTGRDPICFLGWDWTNGGPGGTQDGGWSTILQSAITQVAGNSPVNITDNIVVNSISDTATGSGIMTLRDAVTTADSSTAPTAITFDPTVFATAQTIVLDGSALELTNTNAPATITGPAAGVTISGNNLSQGFVISGGVTATLSDLTISQCTSGVGAGINSAGILTLTDCTLSNNDATSNDDGGGLALSGTSTLINDTLADNTGDGLDQRGGATTLVDCTISGNYSYSPFSGAGIYLQGGGTATISNTIIAGNTAASGGPDVFGTFNSLGNNLIGGTDGSSGWISTDLTGTLAALLDPKLGALANNGGPTETFLPLAGSPAIDAGSVALIPSGITTDQRGVARVVNGTVDIGSVESGAAALPTASKLAFAAQPASAVVGTLAAISIDLEDSSGTIVTTDDSSVTLTLSGGTAGAVLAGTATVAAINGVATFSNLSIATPGSDYTLTASDGSDAAAASRNFSIYAAPESIGGLNLSFGTGGLAGHDVGFASTNGVAQDGTQSVIIGTVGSTPGESFGVTRYNANGSWDRTFGNDGISTSSFGGTDDVPSAVDVLPSGQILVAGTANTYTNGIASGSEFAVAEFNPDGSVDTSFGNGGQVLVSFSTTAGELSNDTLKAMVTGPGGIIYLGGSSDAAGATGTDFALAALNAAGTLDTGFGTGGMVLQSFGTGDDLINSLALQTNGDIVAAGSATVGGVTEIALARFLPSGALDTRFGTKGLVTTNVRGVYDSASSVVIQPKGGDILIGGLSATGSGASLSSDFVVARYTSAGKIDKSFGGGPVITSFGQPSAITQLALTADGEIIASGKTTASLTDVTPSSLDVAVARYSARGALDTSFNGTGKAIVDLTVGVIAGADAHTVSLSEMTIEPLDSSLGSEFDAFTSSQQGVVSITPGGAILDAGNNGSNTVEAEFITAGVDLAASLIASLPAAVVGGAKATVSVNIQEVGTDQATGIVTIDLQVAADALGDGETTFKTVTEKISLKQKQSRTYKIAFVYPQGIATADYYLVAAVVDGSSLTDLNAQNNLAPSSSAVNIAPAFISLAGSALSAGSAFTDGKTSVVICTVTNNGNVQAKGVPIVDLILSTDQTAADGTIVDPAKLSVSLAAGKSKLYRISFKLPKAFAAGMYYLIAVIDPVDSLGTIDQSDSTVFDPTQVVVG